MESTSTFMLTIRRTTISSILGRGSRTCSIWTSYLLLSHNLFMLNFPKNVVYIEIMNCKS